MQPFPTEPPQHDSTPLSQTALTKLLVLAYSFTLCAAVVTGMAILIVSPENSDQAVFALLALVWSVVALVLLWRGYAQTSATAFTLLLFANFTLSALTAAGVYSFAFSGYIVVVILAALFLGKWLAYGITAAVLLAGVGIVLATYAGDVQAAAAMPLSPWATWGMYTVILVTVFLFVRANVVSADSALQQSQESEALFRGVFESAGMGVTIVQPGGSFIRANRRFQNMLGYSEAEMQHMGFEDLTHPDDLETEWQLVRRMRAGAIREYQMEKRYVRKDGTVFWGRLSASIVRSGEQVVYGIAIVEDIHERKEAELALRRSEARYRTLIEHFPNGLVALYDQDLVYTLVGGKGLEAQGMKPEDLQGRRLRDVFPPEVYERDEPALRAALAGDATVSEVQFNGSAFRVFTLPVRDNDGMVSGGMVVTQDVTEVKRAAEQQAELELARQKSGMLVDLIETISHDVKTPLSVINTSLYLLQRHTDPAERQRKIDAIDQQTQILERYINDLLAVTRLENVPDVTLAPVNVNIVAQAVVEELRPKADNESLSIEAQLADDLPLIPGNLEDLHRALLNLVDNAINYTPAGGAVRVKTGIENRYVVMTVQDTGVGIQPRDLPHIFKRFYRAENARSVNRRGTGLGLAIVQHIIELHGGRIEVQSTLGQGTTFSVYLPTMLMPPPSTAT